MYFSQCDKLFGGAVVYATPGNHECDGGQAGSAYSGASNLGDGFGASNDGGGECGKPYEQLMVCVCVYMCVHMCVCAQREVLHASVGTPTLAPYAGHGRALQQRALRSTRPAPSHPSLNPRPRPPSGHAPPRRQQAVVRQQHGPRVHAAPQHRAGARACIHMCVAARRARNLKRGCRAPARRAPRRLPASPCPCLQPPAPNRPPFAIPRASVGRPQNWTSGSPQYDFVLEALQSANRTQFPWLVVNWHRCARLQAKPRLLQVAPGCRARIMQSSTTVLPQDY